MNDSTLKKAVVTGGAGFIGSHLSAGLVKHGYNVIILDDLSSGKKENITKLIAEEGVEFNQGSITDYELLMDIFRDANYVFHLAAVSSVPLSLEDPLACHEVNAAGTLNVLTAARDSGVSKVVYASSCAVYGDRPVIPTTEDTPTEPRSPYAITKLSGEHYCRIFRQVYDLNTVSLRLFNVYGPGQEQDSPYSAVIPAFIKRVSAGSPPVIYGDGSQTRDLTFITDAVEAIMLAAESEASGVYNIGRGESITIGRLARLIISLSGKNLEPIYEKPRAGDVMHSLADISRARAFGYKTEYNLEDGLNCILERSV
jgi:UDP-glucose 4-epimerase